MFYVKVANALVVDRTVFDQPMPPTWPDRASWHQNDVAQIGWSYDGTTFSPPPPPPPTFDDGPIMGGTIRDVITSGV